MTDYIVSEGCSSVDITVRSIEELRTVFIELIGQVLDGEPLVINVKEADNAEEKISS